MKISEIIERYFAGTYFFFLDKENGAKYEAHWYFAVSSLLLIVIFSSMFLTMVYLTFGDNLELVNWWSASLFVGLLLIVGYLYFLRRKRYAGITEKWLSNRAVVTKSAMWVNWSMLACVIVLGLGHAFA